MHIKRIESCYPEQYEVTDENGHVISYMRVRWGYFKVFYPNAESNNVIYSAKLKNGWWNFENKKEQEYHLMKAMEAIKQIL